MTLEEFYKKNYPIVFGYLFSLCGDRTMAEDLASETFLRAMQKISSYDGTCKPSTWLCTIGKNLYFNEQKRQNRHVSLENVDLVSTVSFEESLITNEQIRLILKSASHLAPMQQQVFFMRINGMPFRDIGDALGKTETWARVTFFRAKNDVLEKMEGYDG